MGNARGSNAAQDSASEKEPEPVEVEVTEQEEVSAV